MIFDGLELQTQGTVWGWVILITRNSGPSCKEGQGKTNVEGRLLGLWWIGAGYGLCVFRDVVVSVFGVWYLSHPSSCRIRPPCLIG